MSLTDITILVDRSGSMVLVASDHSGGINTFMKEQAANKEGDLNVSLIQFDSQEPFEVVFSGDPADAPEYTLHARGGTPLLDAVCKAIAHTAERIEKTKPDSVLFQIITDGLENMSREVTKEDIKKLIDEKQKAEWHFDFLGANQDAFAEAGGFGIARAGAANFDNTSEGTRAVYGAMSAKAGRVRNAVASGQSVSSAVQYTQEEKLAMSEQNKLEEEEE